MSCFQPLAAWQDLSGRSVNGKAKVVFQRPAGPSAAIRLPCGQCIGCRLDKSREWALRCVHEASLYDDNCFVTLTYDDEKLPPTGTLVKRHHQNFMKELRGSATELAERIRDAGKYVEIPRIRFFMCGEYGDRDERPHYHFLLFNWSFPDRYEWCSSKGNTIYRSKMLESIWRHGFSWIGDVTWQSAAYVARYSMKKVNGANALDKYVRNVDPDTGECDILEPEYVCMSRRPGIGRDWYDRYGQDCRKDFLTHDGRKHRVPRYYDHVLELEDVEELARRKRLRKEHATEPLSRKRLADMMKFKERQTKQLIRSL